MEKRITDREAIAALREVIRLLTEKAQVYLATIEARDAEIVELKRHMADNDNMQAYYKEIQNMIGISLEKNHTELMGELNPLMIQAYSLSQGVKQLQGMKQEYEDKKEEYDRKIEEVDEKISKYKKKKEEYEDKLKKLDKKDKTDYEAQIKELQNEKNNLNIENSKLRIELKNDRERYENERDNWNKEKENLQRRLNGKDVKIEGLQAQIPKQATDSSQTYTREETWRGCPGNE